MRAHLNHYFGLARLISGLILFFYVLTHNLNHALGLISVEALEAGRVPFVAFRRNPLIQWLFYLAAVTHFLLAMRVLYNRRSLRMPFWEGAQLVLGLSAPLLHFLGAGSAILDNPPARKGVGGRRAIAATGARRRCLPPDSPDRNPIETAFSKRKAAPRKAAAGAGDGTYTAAAQNNA